MKQLIPEVLKRKFERRTSVPVSRCYHYRAFRYGGFGSNPYEDFALGLARGTDRRQLRQDFADTILRYRCHTLGDALQISIAPRALWIYPWSPLSVTPTVILDPTDNPDIVCHHCNAGVLASHLNREFEWLEQAFRNLSREGYRPGRFGFIRVQELVGRTDSSFLVLDGNHRLSALVALGVENVDAKATWSKVHREQAPQWPHVRSGSISIDDALAIFDRYSWSANPSIGHLNPAKLLLDEPLAI